MKCYTLKGNDITNGLDTVMLRMGVNNVPVVQLSRGTHIYLADKIIKEIGDDGKIYNADYIVTRKGTKLLIPSKDNDNSALVLALGIGINSTMQSGEYDNVDCTLQGHRLHIDKCPICGASTVNMDMFPEIARKINIINNEEQTGKYVHLYKGQRKEYKSVYDVSNMEILDQLLYKGIGRANVNKAVIIKMDAGASIVTEYGGVVEFNGLDLETIGSRY